MTESATIMVVEDEQLFAKELKDRLENYGLQYLLMFPLERQRYKWQNLSILI